MTSYLMAIGILVGMMIIWGLVQILWMKSFPEYRSDVDALALREDCHGCENKESCHSHGHENEHQKSMVV
ncbi:MAG: hypothetical protein CSA81_12720 [Acidobacteria bacterium]|nr:MAG: hypothetical protein CSA81_12720 [Acidobacteriota bacterium]PIE88971.1 MAG: hypothetical protein CR997_13680 [Acidobacteriota bacterium]